ncbi:MFS transporter [bacterium]|nr:MFS transporter [bacterium]
MGTMLQTAGANTLEPISEIRDPEFETRTIARVLWRIIPFIILLQFLNYLDRVNVSFAKLTMSEDLGFSESVYGFGAGIFFVSYFIFEIPSNLILDRVGARLWLARIMITWGVISSLMMFVKGAASFYTLRFLLGAAEAGFAPGILLYFTYWLPLRLQARAVAWFLTATAFSGLIGSPVAGWLLKLDGTPLFGHPLAGWQWLFLLEGIPSALAGIAVLIWLTDRPEHARWLTAGQREWLSRRIADERRERLSHGCHSLKDALISGRVWLLAVIYVTLMFAFQVYNFWLATIIKQAAHLENNVTVGLLTAIPYTAAAVAMVFAGRHSDRTGERRWHVIVSAGIAAAALLLCAWTDSPALTIALLAVGAAGVWSTLGPFWAIPPVFLTGAAASAGIALINSFGNLGGFIGPYLVGVLKDYTHGGYKAGLVASAVALILAGVLTWRVKHK